MLSVEAEPTDTISALKGKIETANADLAAVRQKLIYKGNLLKDTQVVGELDLVSDPDAYMVCMLAKVKAAKAEPVAVAPAAPATTVDTSSSGTSATAPVAAPAPAPAAAAPAPAPAAAPAAAPAQEYATPESIASLTAMGYPEAEVRAALNAAMGNPDMAFEFLNTGIPDNAAPAPPAGAPAAPAGAPAATGGPVGIESLRNHPQFAALQQTVQSNPSALPQILQVIGQQQPELLEAIHSNEAAFLAMMNEPIAANPPAAPAAPAVPTGAPAGGMPGMPGMGGGEGANVAALLQMMQQLPEDQRAAMAQQMGIPPEQLAPLMQALQQIPPEQMAAMMGGAGGGMGGGGGPPPGTIQLTQEEMEAVQRLESLGYSRQQAAQAFLACDKNEMLAANMLMDGGFADEEEG